MKIAKLALIDRLASGKAIALAAALAAITAQAQTLHFDRPAEHFEEALVIGNGNIGAIVYGGIGSERISLNDITL